jgi:hypothetical protein
VKKHGQTSFEQRQVCTSMLRAAASSNVAAIIDLIDSCVVIILIIVTVTTTTTITATINYHRHHPLPPPPSTITATIPCALAEHQPALLPVRMRSVAAERQGEAGGSGCDWHSSTEII